MSLLFIYKKNHWEWSGCTGSTPAYLKISFETKAERKSFASFYLYWFYFCFCILITLIMLVRIINFVTEKFLDGKTDSKSDLVRLQCYKSSVSHTSVHF